jgi:hypothetical protein
MTLATTVNRIWKGAQLYIGFHKDTDGNARDEPHLWPPKNARATIHEDANIQEVFAVVQSHTEANDVQIKMRSDKIILRRDSKTAWHGIIADEHAVSVVVGDTTITINHDGSVKRTLNDDTTSIEADGSIFKSTAFADATMSGDGTELVSRTENNIAAVKKDGVVMKAR